MTATFNLLNEAIEQIGEGQKLANTACRQIGKAESTIYNPNAPVPLSTLESAERHILSTIRMLRNAQEAIQMAMACRPSVESQSEAKSPESFTPRVCIDNSKLFENSGGIHPRPQEPPRTA